jgi:hypothetical protein
LESYFAITANTVQFGARAYLRAEAGGFTGKGHGGFDVLVQVDPFYLRASVDARIDVAYQGEVFMHASLGAHLEGPKPWHAWGHIEVEVLVASARLSVDFTIGKAERRPPPSVDLGPVIAAALTAPDAWSAELPPGASPGASLRALAEEGQLVVHPMGRFTIRQRAVPLATDISRYGSARIAPGTPNRFEITDVTVAGIVVWTPQVTFDAFAPGEYVELSDDERLTHPGFEDLPSGVVAATSGFRWPVDPAGLPLGQQAAITYDQAVIDMPPGGAPRRRKLRSKRLEKTIGEPKN